MDTNFQVSALPRELVARQHGVVTRSQLLALGFSSKVVAHRLAAGRLHPMYRGVYAVGRPQVGRHGRWLAAVLACGPRALLSHVTAGALREIVPFLGPVDLHVSVPLETRRRVPGVLVHRRALLPENATHQQGVPVTDAVTTLLDLATVLTTRQLETAINEADKRDLVSPGNFGRRWRLPVGGVGRRHSAPSWIGRPSGSPTPS